MSENRNNIDKLKQEAENFTLPVDDQVWNSIESRIAQNKKGGTSFKKRSLLLLIPFLSVAGYFIYSAIGDGNEEEISGAVSMLPEDKVNRGLDQNGTSLVEEVFRDEQIIAASPRPEWQEPEQNSVINEVPSTEKIPAESVERGLEESAEEKDFPNKKEPSTIEVTDKATQADDAPSTDEGPVDQVGKSSTNSIAVTPLESKRKPAAPNEETPTSDLVSARSTGESSSKTQDDEEDAGKVLTNTQDTQRETPKTQREMPTVVKNTTAQMVDSVKEDTNDQPPAAKPEPVHQLTNRTTDDGGTSTAGSLTKRGFFDALRLMPFYGYGMSNRKLSSKELGDLVDHKNDHETASNTNRFGLRMNYHFRNKSFIGAGLEYTSYGEHYDFQHDIVTHETDNKYQYVQVSLSYGQHLWGKGRHDLFALVGGKWSLLDRAQSSWVDTQQLTVVSHNNRGIGQPFRNNTYVLFGGLEYSFRLNDRFRLHVFPVYDRFLSSVYNTDTDLDQKQYSMSMNVGISIGF